MVWNHLSIPYLCYAVLTDKAIHPAGLLVRLYIWVTKEIDKVLLFDNHNFNRNGIFFLVQTVSIIVHTSLLVTCIVYSYLIIWQHLQHQSWKYLQ